MTSGEVGSEDIDVESICHNYEKFLQHFEKFWQHFEKDCKPVSPKTEKVGTFIYIIGHRVVHSTFGKGEVSNK